MRKIYLFIILLFVFFISATVDTYAQAINFMGPRLFVNQPTGISGLKKFTYSSSSATGTWGRALDSSWFSVQLVKSQDSLGCSQPVTANYTGKWVLIWRGTCQFGEKAKYAQDKGAAGVIIINNVPGAGPVGMAAGSVGTSVKIPVLMVSNPDGATLWSTLASQTVLISITRWGFNNTNDLAIIPKAVALGPGSIPLSQWKAGNGTPNAYKFYTGALVANVGTANQNNVKITSVITFTPTGGSSTVVYTDSAVIPSLSAIDSIDEVFSPRSVSLNPPSTGKYKVSYALTSGTTDQNPLDDTTSFSVDVTSNTFSKCRLDANNNPIVTGGIRVGSTPPPAFVWGPLFYTSADTAKYRMQAIKFAISDDDTSKHALTGNAVAYVFKWVDGSNGGKTDQIIQPAELDLKAAAIKDFTTADSNNQVFTAYVGKPDGTAGNIFTEANTWYWVIVDMPGSTFLGIDGDLNYYTRSSTAKNATPSVIDYWAPNMIASQSVMLSNSSDSARMIPFGLLPLSNAHNIDSASFANLGNTLPAVAFEINPFKVNVEQVNVSSNDFILYPNPATDAINVKLNLNKVSDKVQIRIVNALGRSVYTEDMTNKQNETITLSTAKYAAGNYYVVVIANGYATVKPFTLISK